MSKVPAWLLPIADFRTTAVGEAELVHVLPDAPMLFEIPGAPRYCRKTLVWDRRIVPVMDLAVRFPFAARDSEMNPENSGRSTIGIFAYWAETAGSHEYGALLLGSPPRRCEVGNGDACRLPADWADWAHYTSSCFQPEGTRQAIPILRLDRLFSSENLR